MIHEVIDRLRAECEALERENEQLKERLAEAQSVNGLLRVAEQRNAANFLVDTAWEALGFNLLTDKIPQGERALADAIIARLRKPPACYATKLLGAVDGDFAEVHYCDRTSSAPCPNAKGIARDRRRLRVIEAARKIKDEACAAERLDESYEVTAALVKLTRVLDDIDAHTTTYRINTAPVVGHNAEDGYNPGAPLYRRQPVPEGCEKCVGCPDCLTNTPPTIKPKVEPLRVCDAVTLYHVDTGAMTERFDGIDGDAAIIAGARWSLADGKPHSLLLSCWRIAPSDLLRIQATAEAQQCKECGADDSEPCTHICSEDL